jgi:hypothetical protein
MTVDQTANFVRGGVSSSVGSADTTINVDDASTYPDPTAGRGEYNLVIWDLDQYIRPDLDPNAEIVRVTGRDTTNDTLTVQRGQENTTAASHPSTSELHLSATSKNFDDIDSKITSSLTISGSGGLNGGSAELGSTIDLNISGNLSLDSDLEAVDGETIWDESATEIPDSVMGSISNSTLTNSSVTVAGNSVSLGGTTSINHNNLSTISSDDHHTKYTDENAQDAVGTIVNGGTDLTATYDDANNTITFDHNDTSTQGNVSAGGGAAITDVNLDGRGHITSISTTDLSSSYDNYSNWTLRGDNGTTTNINSGNTFDISGGTDISTDITSTGGTTVIDVSHNNTSSQGNVSTGGATVIDDINLDGRGHVTGLNTQNRSLDDWANANADVDLGNNDLTGVAKIDGDSGNHRIRFDDNNSYIEISDQSNNRTSDLVVQDVYIDDQGVWLADDTIVTVSGGTDISGGSAGLTGSLTVDHADTSSQGNVSAGGGAAITDINLDGRGHVTSISTTDLSSSYDNYGHWGLEDDDGNNTSITSGTDVRIDSGSDISTNISSTGGYTEIDISHSNTTSQGDTTTGGSTVIDDIYIDGNGHVTNMNTQNRSLDDWNGANSNLNIGHNNLYNVNKIEDNGVEVYLDDGNSRVEIQDNNSNRIEILASRIYLENGAGWFDGNHAELVGVGSSDHHSKTSSASELSDVSPDSDSNAHHNPSNQDVDSVDGYDITKNGGGGSGIIDFQT